MDFWENCYQAKSWKKAQRVCARIEATPKGLDVCYIATCRTDGSADYVHEVFYCACSGGNRAQAHQIKTLIFSI
jgi:hypothetical protein